MPTNIVLFNSNTDFLPMQADVNVIQQRNQNIQVKTQIIHTTSLNCKKNNK